jgi:serine/threonine protein kinase
MSPEQIVHPKKIDKRTDIYSAGIVLYEMLTGDVPFDGESDFSIKNKQVNTPTPDPRQKNPKISAELVRIILKAMNKAPEKRYQNCTEFLEQIEDYESIKKDITDGRSNKLLWVVVATVCLLILSLTIAIYVRQFKEKGGVVTDTSESEKFGEKKRQSKEVNRIAELERRKAEQLNVKREHESAAILIQGGIEKIAIICRECVEIELKRKNYEIAKAYGENGLSIAYKKQIVDIEKNIKDGISGYKDIIEKLGSLKISVVENEFEKQTKSLKKEGSIKKIKFHSLVKYHYKNYINNNKNVNDSSIRKACTEG